MKPLTDDSGFFVFVEEGRYSCFSPSPQPSPSRERELDCFASHFVGALRQPLRGCAERRATSWIPAKAGMTYPCQGMSGVRASLGRLAECASGTYAIVLKREEGTTRRVRGGRGVFGLFSFRRRVRWRLWLRARVRVRSGRAACRTASCRARARAQPWRRGF